MPPSSVQTLSPPSSALRLLSRPIRLLTVQGGARGVWLCVVSRKPRPQLRLQRVMLQCPLRRLSTSFDHTGESTNHCHQLSADLPCCHGNMSISMLTGASCLWASGGRSPGDHHWVKPGHEVPGCGERSHSGRCSVCASA